nr:MAG TPA: TFIIB-TERMINAL DOMAIN, TFIIB, TRANSCRIPTION INITIATION [Caudoviricetes sp.]
MVTLFSFCTNCGIIFTDNSPNELLVWSGLKISDHGYAVFFLHELWYNIYR